VTARLPNRPKASRICLMGPWLSLAGVPGCHGRILRSRSIARAAFVKKALIQEDPAFGEKAHATGNEDVPLCRDRNQEVIGPALRAKVAAPMALRPGPFLATGFRT
jgi:hypothetical protein